ncbi:tRNA-uridine aminocarboxypropyltransferase [Gilvimarinus japonicus]|jgi:DTW domain-containing protein YfiP|uniref:tRNA-uridine aminocarboxypropyltransferase n=1 Tax=Gilvimarinus japonicus TaxID=1796469 RepID=A0ABV7HS84_9GAMM
MARALCPNCKRPKARCFCRYIRPIANHTQIILLQHPDESGHPKNTGELLHQCLASSELIVAECIDNTTDLSDTALLYPEQPTSNRLTTQPPVSPKQNHHIKRLIVIDATWRKSRKMLHLNPWLGTLARLQLDTIPASRYRIRTAADHDQLSTFEASCYALQQLEASPALCEQALRAFDDYINHLVSFDPNRR